MGKVKAVCPICEGAGEVEYTRLVDTYGLEILAMGGEVVKEVADEYGLLPADLVGKSRSTRVTEARYRAAKRMRDELEMSLKAIGTVLGGRDHSTIIHELGRAEEMGL